MYSPSGRRRRSPPPEAGFGWQTDLFALCTTEEMPPGARQLPIFPIEVTLDVVAYPPLRHYLVGPASQQEVGDDHLAPGSAHLHGLTAGVLHLVNRAGADGLTLAEVRTRIQEEAQETLSPRTIAQLPHTLDSLVAAGRIGFHYQVVQEPNPRWHSDDIRSVRVYTQPSLAPNASLFGGHRLPAVPRSFRGTFDSATIHPCQAKTAVLDWSGPITRTPQFGVLKRIAASVDRMTATGGPAFAIPSFSARRR